MDNDDLVLKCEIVSNFFGDGTYVKFSINHITGNNTDLLTFTLELINTEQLGKPDKEDLLYAHCYNNVLKIEKLNECIPKEINILLDQYFNLELYNSNNDSYFYVFKFTITCFGQKKNMYCTVTIGEDMFKCDTNFIPDERLPLNLKLDPINHFTIEKIERSVPLQQQVVVNESPNHESNTEPEVPGTYLSLDVNSPARTTESAQSLSMGVNDIVFYPNRNINGLTDKTKMYTDFVRDIYSQQVEDERLSISQQIQTKTQVDDMNLLCLKRKSKNDRIDIRHDIRTILKENDAVIILNPFIGSIYDDDIAGGSVQQVHLLKAQQVLLQDIEEYMTKEEYIFEKMPQTVQKTKSQVFAEFIGEVIIMARTNSADHNNINIAPFVYEESGRGINYENFKKFYKELERDDKEMELFYSNLIGKVSSSGLITDDVYNTVSKYIKTILRYNDLNNPNPTTIKKSKIQQIDACKVGRTQTSENPINGVIREVFGCLDVTIDYLSTNEDRKNMYSVKITNSSSGNLLMTCDVIQDIPLSAVSRYLNDTFYRLITLLNSKGYKQLADTRGDDCEDDSVVGGGNFKILDLPTFETLKPFVQALCIEALKTVCDKLYKLSEPLPRIISTVDDLVRGDPRIDYLFGRHLSCPTVCRSSANGYFVYGGTTDNTKGYSAIFYRNLIFICFLYNVGITNRRMNVIPPVDINLNINIDVLFQDVDVVEQIISFRLINYLNRFNTIRVWCDQTEKIKRDNRDYDFFMIDIICNEYLDKLIKLQKYINNVNSIIGNGINDFSKFYRDIIGLENLENLLTMSSLNFYISNEDYVFNPDTTSTPEPICNQFQGSWVNHMDNTDASQQITHNVIDQNRIDDIFDNILELECDINTITIKFKKVENLYKELQELIGDNDESTVTEKKKDNYILFKTPKTLELLVKLHRFYTCKFQTNSTELGKPTKRIRKQELDLENEKISKILVITVNSIAYTIDVFYQNIGLNIDVISILQLIKEFETKVKNSCGQPPANNAVGLKLSTVINNDVVDDVKEEDMTELLASNIMELEDVNQNGNVVTVQRISSDDSKKSNGSNRSKRSADVSASIDSLSTKQKPITSYKKPKTPVVKETNSSKLRKETALEKLGKTIEKTKKRGGRKPNKSVTRRKNKNSSKRKTIKKRKVSKRKNKTRRQRK
jgi:hypothetical protein